MVVVIVIELLYESPCSLLKLLLGSLRVESERDADELSDADSSVAIEVGGVKVEIEAVDLGPKTQRVEDLSELVEVDTSVRVLVPKTIQTLNHSLICNSDLAEHALEIGTSHDALLGVVIAGDGSMELLEVLTRDCCFGIRLGVRVCVQRCEYMK